MAQIPHFRLPNECRDHFRDEECNIAGMFSEYLKLTLDKKLRVHVAKEQNYNFEEERYIRMFRVFVTVGDQLPDIILVNGSEEDKKLSRERFFKQYLDHHMWTVLDDTEDSEGRLVVGARGFCKECFGCFYKRPFPAQRKRTYRRRAPGEQQKRKKKS